MPDSDWLIGLLLAGAGGVGLGLGLAVGAFTTRLVARYLRNGDDTRK